MSGKPITLYSLIESEALGFCCPAAFFAANEKVETWVLAERLGVSDRTVREHRARWKAGAGCDGHPRCLISSAPDALKPKLLNRVGPPCSASQTTRECTLSTGTG